ncbi:MAG TPA: isocitrate/isopropylmalate dehydrogenase family protein [Candidatus Sulfotelmatobacter sp.]|nr:isocitrate/isopropylmalate dehydrogenase family protein [Candidatus Sulfotelmatobacter sp.]
MANYRIAVLPGDGIGPEVMAEALKALDAVSRAFPGLTFDCREHRVGAKCYLETGSDLPPGTLEACREADAILFGSTGLPDIRYPDGTEIAPQLTLRFVLDLYAGIRPIKRYAGVPPALAGDPAIDYVIIRENTEGLYASRGGGVRVGGEVAVDSMVITRPGTERIVRYAFRLAEARPGRPPDRKRRVTCVDKANVLKSMAFFRQIFDEVAAEFPGILTDHVYVDAVTLHMVQRPLRFDVVVAENMFADIISDLAAGTVGGLGLAPSADVGDSIGLFQPSHGTAPDIAGEGIANPIAQILSARLLLEWLGERKKDRQLLDAAAALETAVEATLVQPEFHTADLGGKAKTKKVGDAVAAAIKRKL